MMKRALLLTSTLLILIPPALLGAGGTGKVSIGYIYLDEEGNRSVMEPAFNDYEGASLSIEDFFYRFDSGLRLRANLQNAIMNNRNLRLGVDKSGLFGVDLYHNQYRRIYDFDGGKFTRRHRSGGSAYFYPHRSVKVFGGGSYVGRTGSSLDLFDAASSMTSKHVDYKQTDFNAGAQITDDGRMLRVEYRGATYCDNEVESRDQMRSVFQATALGRLPRFEMISLFGGFRRFETEYSKTDFAVKSNRGWGGARAALPESFTIQYNFVFDRTGSDSDAVRTDNVTHSFYAAHAWPGLAELTAGYQRDFNDDLDDEVVANSFYCSGWLRPVDRLELRGEFGTRSEDVNSGSRLVGDEERFKYRASAKYRYRDYGTISLRVDSRTRRNDQLGSESDYVSGSASVDADVAGYATVIGGYTYSKGSYKNAEQEFEFRDHTVFGEATSREYLNTMLGFGITYYRSRWNLDSEKVSLRFSGSYRFYESYHFEVEYTVHNFDDFVFTEVYDEYYTANIVRVQVTRDFTL